MDKNKCLTPEQQKLVVDNVAIVNKVIADKFEFLYSAANVDVDEVRQIGKLALCKAAQQYNPSKSKFSTFAYMVVRQDLMEYVTHQCVIIERETPVNDLFPNAEGDLDLPVDTSDLIEDKTITFSDCLRVDVKDAIASFFNDKSVKESEKVMVRAFLYYVANDCSATEAGLYAGAKTEGSARNLIAKGRKVLRERKEFKCLWEAANAKGLAS